MNADDPDPNINSLDALLASKGLDVGDFISAIDAIAKIKERDLKKLEKQEAEEQSRRRYLLIKNLFMKPDRMFLYTEMVERRVVDIM